MGIRALQASPRSCNIRYNARRESGWKQASRTNASVTIRDGPRPRCSDRLSPAPPLFLVFPGSPPLPSCDRGTLPARASDWPSCGALRDWPEAGGPPPLSSLLAAAHVRGRVTRFREPVRKDINKTNPRQHGEGRSPCSGTRPSA